jgi:superfamily II DNA or RNA helicase
MTYAELRTDSRYTPYQAEFFHRFADEIKPGSLHVLSAPIGTGKSFVMAGSISELARTKRLQRVAILTPPALTAQWAYILRDLGQETAVVDGPALRLLRERIGSAADKWPEGVYVMSIDLAKRLDVRELVSAVPWDLIVVDEAHALGGQRLRLIEDLAVKERAPALLLATHAQGKVARAFSERARVFDWRDAVADFRSPQREGAETPLVRETRRYRRSDEEAAVAREVLTIARELGRMKGMILLTRATSSISSLEETLVGWVEEPHESSGHSGALERLLQQVERLRSDSRFECFNSLLEELIEDGIRHVVVFCEYRATLEYLAAAVERVEFRDYQIHAGISAEEHSEVLESFKCEGGLLITTTASEGLSLNFVEAAIHYDLPLSPAAFAQREGRYHRYGRSQSCTVYLFEDETGALPLEGLLLRMVQKIDLITDDADTDVEGLFRTVVSSAE